ncbi:unnamed protein product [Urochloa decumbens]|uniref:Uncharacterized protein n=1 Tax=Urochloa decumbens TaxID=240449 RepID=A0ABC9A7K2_9POAL
MSSRLQCPDKPAPMNVEAILHMKAGIGESSYAQNSSLQKKSTDNLKGLVIDSATRVYETLRPESFTIADLGCASGTNALGVVEDTIRSIGEVCCSRGSPPPEFYVLLNDLPTNDFNTVFSRVPEVTGKLKADAKAEVFLSGVPGSFYGRLFLSRSVHFVCSFNSLHWLSQVPADLRDGTNTPLNKGKMFISSTSPPAVAEAYRRQFQKDLSLFLKSRAAEVVPGGRMVVSMLCRETEECTDVKTTLLWDLLSDSLAALVSQGLLEQEKVDAYDAPYYASSAQEIEEEVAKDGSFSLDYVRTYEANLSNGDAKRNATTVSMAIRAIQESMLSHHFGAGIIDALFHKFTELVTESMEKGEVKSVQIGAVLVSGRY